MSSDLVRVVDELTHMSRNQQGFHPIKLAIVTLACRLHDEKRHDEIHHAADERKGLSPLAQTSNGRIPCNRNREFLSLTGNRIAPNSEFENVCLLA